MILVSEAALARNNDHQEHSDHQDRNGMGSDKGNGSATRSGKDSGATNKNEKSKPGPAGAVTLGRLAPRGVRRAPVPSLGADRLREARPPQGKACHLGSTKSSLELAAALHKAAPHLPIVLATKSTEEIDADRLMFAGIADVVHWPIVPRKSRRHSIAVRS